VRGGRHFGSSSLSLLYERKAKTDRQEIIIFVFGPPLLTRFIVRRGQAGAGEKATTKQLHFLNWA
jgi:hypothetical protein